MTLALAPSSLQHLARGRSVALVSGTNGKTTTTSLLVTALRTAGAVATSDAGANMTGGMVAALSTSKAKRVVLETDEGHLPSTLRATDAEVVALLNLTRDQLDRVGEVRMQAARWREALDGARCTVVANADDPLVTWAAMDAAHVVWVAGGAPWRHDAGSCPSCGSRVDWTDDGGWGCSGCSLARPESQARVDGTHVVLPNGARLALEMALPGEVNRKNALFAVVVATMMGADAQAAVNAVEAAKGAGGRFQSVRIHQKPARLVLAKNPAGWTEALRITHPGARAAVVGINARVQDGRDPSWLWDVPFERLQGTFVVATGDRGRDLAVRLRYAGVEHAFVEDRRRALEEASLRAGGSEVDVLANYSAFQEYRRLVD